jgi:glycogen(starch) synthase
VKILVLSNFYPPHYLGGYELGCRDVVEELKRRGHEIKVLTSTYGVTNAQVDGDVFRRLRADRISYPRGALRLVTRPFRIFTLFRKEWTNQNAFREIVRTFRPDLVYMWNPGKISMSLALLAEELKIHVCYFVSDEWLARYPREDLWFRLWGGGFLPRGLQRLAEPLLRGVAQTLRLSIGQESTCHQHVQFASRFLLDSVVQSGKSIATGDVIHWGIDPDAFPYKKESAARPDRLLYVGQVVPHKGVHTVIEALRIVREKYERRSVALDIVGGSINPTYFKQLHAIVRELGLEKVVRFRGSVARQELPSVYHEHDVLVFPSVWNEPFSITLLEGMSSGLPVIGTETGGSGEILEHGHNALTFPAEDANACALQIVTLLSDQELRERIRRNGRRTIEERFRFGSMVDRIEESVQSVLAGA